MILKHKRLLPIAILSLGVVIFLYLKTSRPEQPPVQPKERIWHVDTIVVQPQALSPNLILYGQVETPDLMKAAAPNDSRVDKIFVREGDRVIEDQPLLTLDPRDFEPKVIQEEARVAELEAMISSEQLHHVSNKQAIGHETSLLKLSKAAVTRAEKMKTKKLGSAAALDQARQDLERQSLSLTERKLKLDDHKTRLKQLQARLKGAQADLDLARLDLERSQVVAPFSGYISEIKVAAGDPVMANQQLLSMYPTDTLEVRTVIPAPYQGELHDSLARGETLQAQSIHANHPVILELNRLSGAADPRGIEALLTIKQGTANIRVGSSLSLHLSRPPHENAVSLPYEALYGNNKIYKLINGRMHSIQITNLGDHLDTHGKATVLVTEPHLKAGDEIITTHLPNAIDGLRVYARQSINQHSNATQN